MKKDKNPLELSPQSLHSQNSSPPSGRLFLGSTGVLERPLKKSELNLKKDVDETFSALTVRPPTSSRGDPFRFFESSFLCDNTAYRISQTLHLVNPAILCRGFYQN